MGDQGTSEEDNMESIEVKDVKVKDLNDLKLLQKIMHQVFSRPSMPSLTDSSSGDEH